MNLSIITERVSIGGDKIYNIQIAPKDMILFGYILESLEGWAFHTIIDKNNNILHVEVMKDYIVDFDKLLDRISQVNL
jgi:hypothetical protein